MRLAARSGPRPHRKQQRLLDLDLTKTYKAELRLYSFSLCSVTKSYIASALIVPIRAGGPTFPSTYEGERKKYEAATNGELFAFVCPLGDS